MQCAQSDDKSRHAGLRPDPLTRKPRWGNTTAGLFAHQRLYQPDCSNQANVALEPPKQRHDERGNEPEHDQ